MNVYRRNFNEPLQQALVGAVFLVLVLIAGWGALTFGGDTDHGEVPFANALTDPAFAALIRSTDYADGIDLTVTYLTPDLLKARGEPAKLAEYDLEANYVFKANLYHIHDEDKPTRPLEQIISLRDDRGREYAVRVLREQRTWHDVFIILAAPKTDAEGRPTVPPEAEFFELVIRGVGQVEERVTRWDLPAPKPTFGEGVSPLAQVMGRLPLLFAFLLGLLTFLSRCVPHTLTVYMSLITGQSAKALTAGETRPGLRRAILVKTVSFVLGYGVPFVVVGATFGALAAWLWNYQNVLNAAAGAMVILLGLNTAGLLKFPVPTIGLPRRPQARLSPPDDYLSPAFLGSGFAVGCAACVAPQLYAVILYAGATGSAAASLAPVTFFVFGLGLPYFAAAWSLGRVMRAMEKIKAYLRFVPLAAGGLSVFLGVLMLVSDKF